MAPRSGVAVPHILLVFPLPTDFCLRAFQLESKVNLVYSDTQGDDRGLRRPGWWERPRVANQREILIQLRINEKAVAGEAVAFLGAERGRGA